MNGCSFKDIAVRSAVTCGLSVSAGGLAVALGGPVVETIGVVAATCLVHNVLQAAIMELHLQNRIKGSSFLFLTAASNIAITEGFSAMAMAYDVLGATSALGLRALGLTASAYCTHEGLGMLENGK